MQDIIRNVLRNRRLQMVKQGNKKIGKRLRQFRKSIDMKGHQFSNYIGISQGTLSDIENCKSDPSASTIVNLASRTNIDIYWLLTGTKNKKNNRVVIKAND